MLILVPRAITLFAIIVYYFFKTSQGPVYMSMYLNERKYSHNYIKLKKYSFCHTIRIMSKPLKTVNKVSPNTEVRRSHNTVTLWI